METTGSCMCGAVRFRLDGPLRPVIACHCTECRKASGHFWAATAVPNSSLVFDADADLVWYASSTSARRGFCGKCGSTLFYDPHGEDRIAVSAGVLDAHPALSTQSHIFVAEKGAYYDLPPDLPNHQGFSGQEKG